MAIYYPFISSCLLYEQTAQQEMQGRKSTYTNALHELSHTHTHTHTHTHRGTETQTHRDRDTETEGQEIGALIHTRTNIGEIIFNFHTLGLGPALPPSP